MDLDAVRLGFELLTSAFAGVLWWNFRMLAATVRENDKELTAFKLNVTDKYAKHTDLDKTVERIEKKLDALFSKMDQKQDKDHL